MRPVPLSVIAGMVGFLIIVWLMMLEQHRHDPPPPAPRCECPRETPDEYRRELLEAARSVGWVCGPRGAL